ncbi:Myosuppressin [Harpegnathos saltator]|uniref:Myosuppressin n=1 Tax=Harpegnathos saltator TaxID=610380 RepID=E2C1M4_HARSA|nr:Myosuppressin [Harpegnathos saltator]
MISPTLMVLVSVTTMAIISGEAFAALPAQCNPGFLEELPPRLRKICVTIARIWDANDMNDFVDDKGLWIRMITVAALNCFQNTETTCRDITTVSRGKTSITFSCASENDVRTASPFCSMFSQAANDQVFFKSFDRLIIDS